MRTPVAAAARICATVTPRSRIAASAAPDATAASTAAGVAAVARASRRRGAGARATSKRAASTPRQRLRQLREARSSPVRRRARAGRGPRGRRGRASPWRPSRRAARATPAAVRRLGPAPGTPPSWARRARRSSGAPDTSRWNGRTSSCASSSSTTRHRIAAEPVVGRLGAVACTRSRTGGGRRRARPRCARTNDADGLDPIGLGDRVRARGAHPSRRPRRQRRRTSATSSVSPVDSVSPQIGSKFARVAAEQGQPVALRLGEGALVRQHVVRHGLARNDRPGSASAPITPTVRCVPPAGRGASIRYA